MPAADLDALNSKVTSYVGTVDELYGHYLDATTGFRRNYQTIIESQANSVRAGIIAPGTDQDAFGIFIGTGSPNDPSNVMQHHTTQGQYKSRNALGGRNHILAAQYLLVLIYEFWETEHRRNVAAALGLEDATCLKLPLLGEVRLLRNDIMHVRGILKKESSTKLELLPGIVTNLSAGSEIVLTEQEVAAVIRAVKAAMDEVVMSAGGADPKHRTIWHVK